jgi:hypothetical protein
MRFHRVSARAASSRIKIEMMRGETAADKRKIYRAG